jgi:wyosine [tRNA(Phe)-imidazoG37] synthetase (radical SAM superfamily)
MKYVYGPVPSRRLGQSLGIDPIPLKTCNWNCVYCQLGRTRPVTNQRGKYSPAKEILAQVKDSLEKHKPGEIDWITIVGSGEPTLHHETGWLIREIKLITDIPVAVITNGSLLYQAEVRDELMVADAILPSLDAGSKELYRRINRPHPECTYQRLVDGLKKFNEQFNGKFWLEVMLVKDLNDTQEALQNLARTIESIRPDQVHINLPTRAPVETWVQTPSDEGLMRALAILGDVAHVVHPAKGTFDLSGHDNLVDSIISIITRHPMREEELIRTLKEWTPEEVSDVLAQLKQSDQAQMVLRYGSRFWSGANAFYPEDIEGHTSPSISRQKRTHRKGKHSHHNLETSTTLDEE